MLLEFLETVLATTVDYAILLFEYVGVIILMFSGFRGIYDCIIQNPLTKLNLAKGMGMGLEFKLGSEILRTVVIRDLSEIGIVAAIIAVRAALTLLIYWEIKNEEQNSSELVSNKTEKQ